MGRKKSFQNSNTYSEGVSLQTFVLDLIPVTPDMKLEPRRGRPVYPPVSKSETRKPTRKRRPKK